MNEVAEEVVEEAKQVDALLRQLLRAGQRGRLVAPEGALLLPHHGLFLLGAEVEALAACDALRVLDMSHTLVRDLQPLAGLRCLLDLDCAHCPAIVVLKPLRQACQTLTRLDLGNTSVEALFGLQVGWWLSQERGTATNPSTTAATTTTRLHHHRNHHHRRLHHHSRL